MMHEEKQMRVGYLEEDFHEVTEVLIDMGMHGWITDEVDIAQ